MSNGINFAKTILMPVFRCVRRFGAAFPTYREAAARQGEHVGTVKLIRDLCWFL